MRRASRGQSDAALKAKLKAKLKEGSSYRVRAPGSSRLPALGGSARGAKPGAVRTPPASSLMCLKASGRGAAVRRTPLITPSPPDWDWRGAPQLAAVGRCRGVTARQDAAAQLSALECLAAEPDGGAEEHCARLGRSHH